MPKLRPEVKKEWVRRLRSGEYKQGRGRLCYAGAYCCWGVLAEMHMEERGEKWGVDVTADGRTYLPSAECYRWATYDGSVREPEVRYAGKSNVLLSELNDRGVPFPVIADLIEEQL